MDKAKRVKQTVGLILRILKNAKARADDGKSASVNLKSIQGNSPSLNALDNL